MATQQKTVTGYTCEFVDLGTKDLQTECSICLHVLRDPHMLNCCGYRFCKCCIERVLSEFKTCPLCAKRNPTAMADKQLGRTLRQKKVKCTHREEGCQWTGELALLDDHLDLAQRVSGCQFKNMRCIHCNISYRKSQIEDHESKCSKKLVCCEYCNDHVCLRHELVEHWESCDLYPIICPKGCGATVTRRGLRQHREKSCPFTIVECEYANVGCEVKVRRGDMNDHLDQYTKEHLAVLMGKYSKLKVSFEKEKEEKRQIEIKLEEAKEKSQHLEKELDETKERQRVAESIKSKEDVILLKRLCDLRAEEGFQEAEDQVVVGNLPLRTTEQMIRSLFGQHGLIHKVKFYPSSLIAVVEYDYNGSIEILFHKYNSTGIRLLGSQLRCVRLGYH